MFKMNSHPHEVKMNMHQQQELKIGHQQMIGGPQHEVKMNQPYHHDVNEVMPQEHLIEVAIELPLPQQEMPLLTEVGSVSVAHTENLEPKHPPAQLPPQPQTQPAPDNKKSKVDKKKKEAIDGQAREVIFKVIKFFESEKQNRGYAFPVENVVKRACAATGLSESTIKRIKRDGLRAEATQTRMTGPKKKRVRKTKVQLDYYQLCALRGIVNSYAVRKEVPTLGKILAAAKHELNYRGGKESLRLILLNKLGIKFKKCEKKNKKPPEQAPPPVQQMQTVMAPQQMQHNMKVMESQCVYTNMLPPVSY